MKRVCVFMGGLLLMTVLLRPLGKTDWTLDGISKLESSAAQRQRDLEAQNRETLSALVKERTERAIRERTRQDGKEREAEVLLKEVDGIPVPWEAVLSGSRDGALSQWLESELGIPVQRQRWNG